MKEVVKKTTVHEFVLEQDEGSSFSVKFLGSFCL